MHFPPFIFSFCFIGIDNSYILSKVEFKLFGGRKSHCDSIELVSHYTGFSSVFYNLCEIIEKGGTLKSLHLEAVYFLRLTFLYLPDVKCNFFFKFLNFFFLM